MDSKIKNIIRDIQIEVLPKERTEERKRFEDSAIQIIKTNLGKLTKDHVGKLVNLLDLDYLKGKQRQQRFGLMLWGRSRKLIVNNDENKLNLLFSEVYEKEKLDGVEVLISDLKGVGDGFVSCLLYLKDRNRYNIFVGATAKGVLAAFPEERDFSGSFKERYTRFNELANKVKKDCNLESQEVDVILTLLPGWIGEVEEEKVTEVVSVKSEIIDPSKLTHNDVQGILLELGNLLGYKIYVSDPSKPYKSKSLKDCASLSEIPLFTYSEILETIRYVDVIWFSSDERCYPEYCFEVEHTTNVTNGLLRMYQLKDLGAKFFIIAHSDAKTKFDSKLKITPFCEIKDRYIFRSYDELVNFFDLARSYYSLKETFL